MYFLHSIRQGSRRLCLLQPLLYLPLPLADRLGRILPCDITVQIFQQVLTGGFELIANQPQPQKPGAEGVLFVLRLGSGAHGPLLDQRLMGDCQTQLDVTLDFSRVEGRIEHPKLNGSLAEHTVQIQGMIPGAVVVNTPPGRAVVPQGFKLGHGLGAFEIHVL